jgi:hypothetical protein
MLPGGILTLSQVAWPHWPSFEIWWKPP